MRLAIVHSMPGIGGGERWCVSFLAGMRGRGHATWLVARRGTAIVDLARASGVDVRPHRMGGDLDPTAVLPVARTLARLAPDLVLANNDKDVRLAGIAGALLAGVPMLPRSGVEQRLKDKWYYRLFYRHLAVAILANSRSNRAVLLGSAPWLSARRVHVLYNGVVTDRFARASGGALRGALGLDATVPLVGYLGRYDGRKGVADLLEAWAILRRDATGPKPPHLVLVGEGPEQPALRQRAADLFGPASEDVHWLGFRDDVAECYPDLDVFVLPSLWEGFSNALLEAMAAGRPVVTSDASSMPELVRHEETGLLVPLRDPAALAAALRRLLSDEGLRRRLGQQAQRDVRERHDFESMLDAAEALLARIHRDAQLRVV